MSMDERHDVESQNQRARERVLAGAALLDQHKAIPAGWRGLIDWELLNMDDYRWCVLGQIGHALGPDEDGCERYYCAMTEAIFAEEDVWDPDHEERDHGFITGDGVRYTALNEAWIAYLTGDPVAP